MNTTTPTPPRQGGNIDRVLGALKGVRAVGNGAWVALCPAHQDRHASLSISLKDNGKVLLCCHAGCQTEAIVTAAGVTMGDLFPKEDGKRPTRPKGKGEPVVTRYEVRNRAGELVGVHERRDTKEGKTFAWYRSDGSSGLDGQPTRDLPLFGVHLLKDVPNGKAVVVCEGEKAAACLQGRGITAVGTVTGAAGTPGDEALSPLHDFPVVLWADADEAGRAHMERIGCSLVRLGHPDVRVVNWPDAPAKGDAADFAGDVEALLAQACPFVAPAVASTAELLADLETFVRRFVVVGEAEYTVLSLWVLHTHTIEACDFTPYLFIHSPEKECGKSRLLEILELVAANPWTSVNTTAAALMRVVASKQPTVMLDEVDNTFGADPDATQRIHALLNSGFRRGGKATVTEKGPTGFEVREFPTFSCKALAGIGHLRDTTASRCLPIGMRRRAGEPIERLRDRDVRPQAKALVDRLTAWAPTMVDQLREARPEVPDSLTDRQADVSEPLLAIADLARGNWPERARAALVKLCGHQNADDGSLGVRLLTDIRTVFANAKETRLATADLMPALMALEESPWGEVRQGRPLDARWLAARLKSFGVSSQTIRLGDGRTPKGYYRTQFEDPWARYLPSLPIVASATPPQPNADGPFPDSPSATGEVDVADEEARNANANAGCGVVPDGQGEGEGAPNQCDRCRGDVFWRRRGNGNPWRCAVCHPPAPGLDVETAAIATEDRQDSGGGGHGGKGRAG